jgi:cyclic-di-GMP phosphodiesterase TipF (flagellum assembly factor)
MKASPSDRNIASAPGPRPAGRGALWLVIPGALVIGLGAALLLGMLAQTPAVVAWLGGAVVFLALVLGHEIRLRVHGEAAVRQGLAQLAGAQGRIAREVEGLRAPTGGGRDVGAVIAEVKVLQSLVEQLYTNRASEAAPVAPAAVRAAPVAPGRAPTAPSPVAVPAVVDERAVLEALRDGLREDHIELVLQPIVGLPQRKQRHFECFSWVRMGDGSYLRPEQFIHVAEKNGLLTAVDNLMLFRCIQLLRRLRQPSPAPGFFCNVSPNTLSDRAFFRDFVAFMEENAGLAPNIVFEFPQRALASLDGPMARDLEVLAKLGFRYSLDQVTDLDFDPAELSERKFRFVKIEAARLLPAIAGEAGMAGGRAFKRRLDGFGLDLVVEKVEDESTLLELLDLNIDFGQGYLFGEPKLAQAWS